MDYLFDQRDVLTYKGAKYSLRSFAGHLSGMALYCLDLAESMPGTPHAEKWNEDAEMYREAWREVERIDRLAFYATIINRIA